MLKEVGIFLLIVVATTSQKLPNYIKKCEIESESFYQCSLKSANEVVPRIAKGDKKFGIPVLDPLHLPLIAISQQNFNLNLTDVEILGLKTTTVKDLKFSPEAFDIHIHIDFLEILGKYRVNGNVLILALQGEGPANITAVGGDYFIKAEFTPYTKNGLTYLRFNKPTIDFTLSRAYFNFKDLFTGDQSLGVDINEILNENWHDVLKDIGAPIKETIATIVEAIVSNIVNKVPQNEIF